MRVNRFVPFLLPWLIISSVQAETCDVDTDGDIDRNDIIAISMARNTQASGADDPRDANGDGRIDVLDARACTLQCTLARCAVVVDINNAPSITSTPVTTAFVGQLYSYDVDAVDPDVGDVLAFSLDVAPAGMSIDASTGLIQWTPAAGQAGTQNVSVRVEDGNGGVATQDFVIDVGLPAVGDYEKPAVILAVNPVVVNAGDSVDLTVFATDNTAVVATRLEVGGIPLALDAAGTAVFSSPTPAVLTATATASDAAGNQGQVQAIIRFLLPGDTVPPAVAILLPPADTVLTLPAQIIGTAFDDIGLSRYWVEVSPAGFDDYIEIASSDTAIVNDVLAELDTALLRDGFYDIRLRAEDQSGNAASTVRTVRVEDETGGGFFSTGFNDLSVTVPGPALEVLRRYDSRDKQRGDFGYGWNLENRDVRIGSSRVLGESWSQTRSGGLFPTYRLLAVDPHDLALSFADGRFEVFAMRLNPASSVLIPFSFGNQTNASFAAESGSNGSLAALDDNFLFPISSAVGPVELFNLDGLLSGLPYNPDRFRFTDLDGSQLILNRNTGLEQITDINGDTLTLTSSGLIHSSGQLLTFERDGEGRIRRVFDAQGASVLYEYDFYGDLFRVTDSSGVVTHFTYDARHNLLDIIDADGVPVVSNAYDDRGRLISSTGP